MANSPRIQPHQPAPTDPNLQIEHHEYIDPFRDIFSEPKAQAALDAIDHVHRAIDNELPDTEMLRLLRGNDGAIALANWLHNALAGICDDERLMAQDRPAAEAHLRTMKTAVETLQQIETTAAVRVTQSISDQLAAHSTQNNLVLSLLEASLRFKKRTVPPSGDTGASTL